jgi:hypothetical protein
MAEERIRDYIIEGVIGAGGMGMVYLARHETLQRRAAIKVLLENLTSVPQLRERFIQEAQLMDDLNHPNIVTLYDFTTEPRFSLIMEYVDGRGLDRMIGHEVGPIPWEKALPLFIQILDGIGYAHGKGIIHRDIKPANILVSKDGKVKITDLGIAKIAGQKGMTRTGTQMGTLYYESPEQIRGAKDVDQRSDIYSLGMTLYEMLAGRLPFDDAGDTSEYAVMDSIVKREENLDPRKYYPHIPEWLVEVVQKATSLNPEKRFQSCEVFTQVLEKHGNLSGSESGYWSGRVASAAQAPLSVSTPISTGSPSPVASEDRCPKCGVPVKEEMEFCGKCGGDLQKNCPACGKKIHWHHEFCPKCGGNIVEKLAEEQKKQKEDTERKRIEDEHQHPIEKKLKEQEEKLLRKRAWRKKHWWKFAASFLVVVVLAAISYLKSDAYAYQQAERLYNSYVQVTITNDLGAWEIEEVYVDLCDDPWGANRITEVMEQSDVTTIRVPAGTYDIKIVDEDGDSYTRSDIVIGSEGYGWEVTLSDID